MGIEYWNCRCPAKFRAGDCSIKMWNLIIPFNPYLLPAGHVPCIALPRSCSNYYLKIISMGNVFQGGGVSPSPFGQCWMLFVTHQVAHCESAVQPLPATLRVALSQHMHILSSQRTCLSTSAHLLHWAPFIWPCCCHESQKFIIYTVYIRTHTYTYTHILKGCLVSEDGEGKNYVKQKCPKINLLLRPTCSWLCVFRGAFVSVPESFLGPAVPTLPLSVFPRFRLRVLLFLIC